MSKIILFRTEDLKVNSPGAYQPILSQEELSLELNSEQINFIDAAVIDINAPLPFNKLIDAADIDPSSDQIPIFSTANDIYRISTTNWRLKDSTDGKILVPDRFKSFFKILRKINRPKTLICCICI